MAEGDQIQGLPPGVELRPVSSTQIEGLPAGAELRPIGGGAAPQLTDNPGGQGTYAMWDTSGNKLAIPYGNVPTAQQQGYKFDTNKDQSGVTPAQRFAKDWAADPNAQHHAAWYGFTPGNLASNVGTGVKQLAKGAVQTANDIGGAILPHAVGGDRWNDLQLVHHVVDPMQAAAAESRGDFAKGDIAAGVQHAVASGAPVFGPWASDLVDQAASGDIGGALARGGTQVLAPKVAGSVLSAAGKVAGVANGAPLGEMVSKPRGTVPAEAYSPTELKAYADEHGIPLNAAQATEHNFPRNLQSAGERATIGGTAVRQQTQAGQAAVMGHVQNLMNQFSDNTPDLATAGERIQQNIAQALAREKQAAQEAYADIDKDAGDVRVNLFPVKKQAGELLNESKFVRENVGTLDPKRASKVVYDVQGMRPRATFAEAQQLRSALLDESRHPDVVISQQGQAWIKKLTEAVDQQMQEAAGDNPELMEKFRQANSNWEGIQENFNNPRSPLYQALQETDPNKIPQKFMAKGQIGGSPYNAQVLDKYGIDKSPIKWALLGDMARKDFGLYDGGKTLAGYSDPFLKSIFTPEELGSVYKTGAIARSLKINTNPSGTAGVESAISDVTHPLDPRTYLKPVAAGLTTSEKFNNWLMKNPAPPSSDLIAYKNWLDRHLAAFREAGGQSGIPFAAAAGKDEKK